MLFNSDRTGREEVFGYVAETGELVRFNLDNDPPAKFPVASQHSNRIYVAKENSIFTWEINFQIDNKTIVEVVEEKLCDYPIGSTHLQGLTRGRRHSVLGHCRRRLNR